MRHRILLTIPVSVLLACGGGDVPDADIPAQEPASMLDARTPGYFVATAPGNAQLVFVGPDSTARPAGREGAAFVPLATFSVERDGIPNEFPPADTMIAALRRAGIGGGSLVIVGDPIPAGRMFAALDYLGLADGTALLDGGRNALAGSAATARDTATPARGTDRTDDRAPLPVSEREDMIVDAAWVHDRLDDPNVVVLDARPPAEYSGATPGTGIDRPGHIPGARNVFWQTLVRSPDDSRLKDEAELRRIFEAAGVGPGSTVVSYCRTGGQASFLYAVARHLGYDVKLYDGSFFDWSRTEYPVER